LHIDMFFQSATINISIHYLMSVKM